MGLTLTQLAFDNFQYADISPLPSPPWSVTGPFTLQVVSELCEGAIAGQGGENYTGLVLPDDQYCSATLPFVGDDTWGQSSLNLAVRASGSGEGGATSFSDGYVLTMNGGVQLELYVVTGNSFMRLAVVNGFTATDGDIWSIAVVGTTVYVLQNGNIVYSTTDTTFSSGFTAMFLSSFEGTAQVSNFSTGSASTGPTPPSRPPFHSYFGTRRPHPDISSGRTFRTW